MTGKRFLTLALTAALLAGLSAPAIAQTPAPDVMDAKCLAFATLLRQQKDTKMQEAGQNLSMFFLGRVGARGRTVDLNKTLEDLKPDLKGGPDAMRTKCGAIVNAAIKLVPVPPATTPASTSATPPR